MSKFAMKEPQETTMKNRTIVVAVVGALALGPMAAHAADTAKQPAVRTDDKVARDAPSLVETNALVGAKVEGTDGKDLGKIDQLLVNGQTGKIRDAVVTTGGIAGIGNRTVVVRWPDLKIRERDGKVIVQINQAVLDRAPEYDKTALKRERDADRAAASPRTEPRDNDKRKSKDSGRNP
jgi:sporulation protein YlmC with PRC-barrel domain